MHLRAQLRRMMIPTMLCAFVAAVTLSPAALAQSRGDSGLPSGPGNPVAQLQQQIDALTQQMASLSSQMAAFSSQSATLDTSGALGVYDANDNRIGDVVGVQDNVPWVSVKTDDHVVALQVFPDRLLGTFLWYTGPNCTGEVYILGPRSGPNVFSVAAVQEPDGVVYAAEAGAKAEAVMLLSVFPSSLFPYNGTCFTFWASQNRTVLPATQLMTLDDVFTRPYSVR